MQDGLFLTWFGIKKLEMVEGIMINILCLIVKTDYENHLRGKKINAHCRTWAIQWQENVNCIQPSNLSTYTQCLQTSGKSLAPQPLCDTARTSRGAVPMGRHRPF